MIDSVPIQGSSISDPAILSDLIFPLYLFDTVSSNPIVHLDTPILRWRMPEFDSIDGYQLEIARDREFTDIVEEWEHAELQTVS